MSTPERTARERAEEFLRDAGEFHLGPLVTEAAHPRSRELSQVAGTTSRPGSPSSSTWTATWWRPTTAGPGRGQPEALRDLTS